MRHRKQSFKKEYRRMEMSIHMTGKKVFAFFMIIAMSIVLSLMETGCDAKSDINNAGQYKTASGNIILASSSGDMSNKDVVYSGQVKAKDGSLISVNLIIKYPLTPGKKDAAVLSYGGKRMCTCQGTYEGENDNKKVFSLMSQNGGAFCDKLDNLEVKEIPKSDKEVSYTASSGDRTTIEEGKLSKAGK
jgi:hypothetical protein